MKIKDGYILKQLGGKYVVIYSGWDDKGLKGMISMNTVGAFIWEKLQNGCTEKELLEAVTEHYDVDAETAEKDIDAVLKTLNKENILEA